MPSTDHNAQEHVTSIGPDRGTAADIGAEQLATDLSPARGAAAAIGAQQLFGQADERIWYFKMRGLDSGAGYTTWVSRGEPDPDGLNATTKNTTPPLVETIVANSGVILAKWGGINPGGSA